MVALFLSLLLLSISPQDTSALRPAAESLLSQINAGDMEKYAQKMRSLSDPGGQERIINGVDAVPGSIPHQVSLHMLHNGEPFFICAGSVIGANVVLTAAHCVSGFSLADGLIVVVYDHKTQEEEGTEQRITVAHAYILPYYVPSKDSENRVYPHDIAILFLKEDVRDKAHIIEMADEFAGDFHGQSCTISGWGLDGTEHPNVLQVANMTVLTRDECMQYWGPSGINIFDGQICIYRGTDDTTGADMCSGDSGGPLICNGVLAGVTSWGVQAPYSPTILELKKRLEFKSHF